MDLVTLYVANLKLRGKFEGFQPGRLQLWVADSSGRVYSTWKQQEKINSPWVELGPWRDETGADLSMPWKGEAGPVPFFQSFAAGPLKDFAAPGSPSDGILALWTNSQSGDLMWIKQQPPNPQAAGNLPNEWRGPWLRFAGPPGAAVQSVCAVPLQNDKRLMLFALDQNSPLDGDAKIWWCLQVPVSGAAAANPGWSDWDVMTPTCQLSP